MLALFKSEVTTWIWQILLPILIIIQVVIVLKSKDQSDKKFDDGEWYDKD